MPDPRAAVLAGRRAAESLMLDTGTAKRPTGGMVYDPVTQTETEDADDLFASKCKIQTRELQAREVEVGGRTAVVVRTELHLPASTSPLRADDLFEITAVDALSFCVVGERFRIVGPADGTLKTARRYEVERVVS